MNARRAIDRAKVILASADGVSGNQICATVGVSRPTVVRWLNRNAAERMAAVLGDRPRSGRPPTITREIEAEIVRKTLHEQPTSGSESGPPTGC